jgi:hypothetical protein
VLRAKEMAMSASPALEHRPECVDDVLEGAPGNALEAEAPLPVPHVPPVDEVIGVVHLSVMLRLEVLRPPALLPVGAQVGSARSSAVRRARRILIASLQRYVPCGGGGGMSTPFTAILHPPLLGMRIPGGIGCPTRYSAHASATVRLSRPKPFAAALLREDDIAARLERLGGAVRDWVRRDWSGGLEWGRKGRRSYCTAAGEAAAGHWPL